jgi:REP element-mobilizing transposase RayT
MKQLQLFQENYKKKYCHKNNYGGELSAGRRKTKRPLNTKQPLHLILRADVKKPIFLATQPTVKKIVQKFADRFNIKIYESSVNANHLHLLIQFADRESYTGFVRAISGRLAQILKFAWLHLPFTRIVFWGRDLKRVTLYIIQNQKEAWGITSYKPRAGP